MRSSRMAGLDDGGRCLMDEINALFAPPGRGDAKKRAEAASKTELHPYFKRPGKGHNHDCCDACGEGGDLICCDSCPASFHFTCHCPPLEEDDIPMGDWSCLRCYHKEQMRLATINSKVSVPGPSTSSTLQEGTVSTENLSNGGEINGDEAATTPSSSQPTKTVGGGNRGRSGRGGNRRQNQTETSEVEKNKVKIYKLKYEKYLKLKPTTNSPFDSLIKATQVMNAEQFKLPPELNPNEHLPFSWKWKDERQDDTDVYSKNCAICSKSSRGVPSVSCDFCPMVYHLDCLDPPLCEIPTDRWMCPSHVEQIIDSKLVTSTRLSERMALWQKYARNQVNVEAVRLEFFRKVRSGKLFQRGRSLKAQRPENMRIKVPQFIKNAYKNPTAGFPLEHAETLTQPKRPKDLSQDEEEWLKGVIALQTSIAQDQMEEIEKPLTAKKKVKRKKAKKEPKEPSEKGDDAEQSDSTDSEYEVDFDVEDGITVQAQEEITKYLSSRKGQSVTKLNREIRDFLASKKINEIFAKDPSKELNIKARAALVPLDLKKRSACPLTFRTFKIGLGSKVDLDLSTYGPCNCISELHATIFFDQYSRTFELLNYSEFGSVVDNLIYSGDVSIHPPATKQDGKLKRMASNSYIKDSEPCFCASSPADHNFEKGCEVSAVLHHGSYIRFGCMQFVFTVLNYGNQETTTDVAEAEKTEEDSSSTTKMDTD